MFSFSKIKNKRNKGYKKIGDKNMAFFSQKRRSGLRRKKVCRFCVDNIEIEYKDLRTLNYYTSDRGKIIPRRISGTCAKHQRALTRAIKRARNIALMPFIAS